VPYRIEWVRSRTIVTRLLAGDTVDAVLIVGRRNRDAIRDELAEPPVRVLTLGTWLAAVTDLGQPLTKDLRRTLPRDASPT
jgi:hypothetical protein